MDSKTNAKGKANPVDNLFSWTFYMIRDQIIAACNAGRPYKLDGFGTWVPALQPDGSVEVQFHPDKTLIDALNDPALINALSNRPETPLPPWITVLDPE